MTDISLGPTARKTARRGSTTSKDTPGNVRTRGLMGLLVLGFVVSVAMPNVIFLGGIRLSPYRIILLVAIIPLIIAWLQGKGGRIYGFDLFMLAFAIWAFLSISVVHGIARGAEAGTILFIETFGAFLLGRIAIRSSADHTRTLKIHIFVILFLLPFSIFETLTGRPILVELAQKIGPAIGVVTDPKRMGLERVQSTFEHEILYGAYGASAIGGMYFALNFGRNFFTRIPGLLLVFVSTFLSLSSGALMAAVFQILLIIYERASRFLYRRWTWFGVGSAILYILIDLLSNRNPFHVVTSYLTFNTGSAYNRILIWRYGTDNVAQNPVFGLGFNDWERPFWMGDSVDNFWLLIAMRHGIPAVTFLILGTVLIIRRVSWAPVEDPYERACRAGYLTVLGGLILASATVHYWNSIYVWFLFLIGSGSYLLETKSQNTDAAQTAPSKGRRQTGTSGRTARTLSKEAADIPETMPSQQPVKLASRYTRGSLHKGPSKKL